MTLSLGSTHPANDILNTSALLLTASLSTTLPLATLTALTSRLSTLALRDLLLVRAHPDGEGLCKHENCCDCEYNSTHLWLT